MFVTIDPTDGADPMEGAAMREAVDLMGTTDAMKWTQVFLEINPGGTTDEMVLFGWFANAIETGRSAGYATKERELRESQAHDPAAE